MLCTLCRGSAFRNLHNNVIVVDQQPQYIGLTTYPTQQIYQGNQQPQQQMSYGNQQQMYFGNQQQQGQQMQQTQMQQPQQMKQGQQQIPAK